MRTRIPSQVSNIMQELDMFSNCSLTRARRRVFVNHHKATMRPIITANRCATSLSLGFGIEDTALEKHCTCDNSLHACTERAQHRVHRPDTQHTLSWLANDQSLVERAWTETPIVAWSSGAPGSSSDAVTPIVALSSDTPRLPGSTVF